MKRRTHIYTILRCKLHSSQAILNYIQELLLSVFHIQTTHYTSLKKLNLIINKPYN